MPLRCLRHQLKIACISISIYRVPEQINGGCKMMDFLMEAVILLFTMGGIFGAIVAMLLKSGKQWETKQALISILRG